MRQLYQNLSLLSGRLKPGLKKTGNQVGRLVDFKRPEAWLTTFTSLLLRLGALFLLVGLVVFLWRMLNYEGYNIQQFNVPKELAEKGFDGTVIARQLEDRYLWIKSIAVSVKEDSIQAVGDEQQPELNVDVLGVGLSLRSIGFHLRDLFGRKNNFIRGEITQADDTLALTLRMSGTMPERLEESLQPGVRQAIDQLLLRAAEHLLKKTDPYRLAIYFNNEEQYEKGIETAKRMLIDRPSEEHWAYLAWGAILENQHQQEDALARFEMAIQAKPDFPLAWMRKGSLLAQMVRMQEAEECLAEAVRLKPDEPSYWNTYANLLSNNGRFEASDEAFQHMAALTEDEPGWMFNWVDRLVSRGQMAEARSLLERVIVQADQRNNFSDQAYAKLFLAMLDRDSANIDEYARIVVSGDLHNGFVLQMITRAYFNSKNYGEAIKVGKMINGLKNAADQKQRTYNLVAMAYNFSGQPDSALVYAQKSISIDTTADYPYSTLAECYHYLGNTPGFFHYLEVAFERGLSTKILQPSDQPYDHYWNTPAFQELLKKYQEPALKD